MIQRISAVWFLVPLPFLNPACTSGSSQVPYSWNLAWRILSITLLACESESEVTQLCPTFCDRMDCSLLGSSIHAIVPGKNTGVGYHFFLQGIFLTQRSNLGLLNCRLILYCLSHWGIYRVHHLKCWGRRITTWNRDCGEKYQWPQICRWYHPNDRKRRGTKKPLDEGDRWEWKSWLKIQYTQD